MHFRCGSLDCRQWFSIADWAEAQANWPHHMVYCPRCGLGWGLPVQSALDADDD